MDGAVNKILDTSLIEQALRAGREDRARAQAELLGQLQDPWFRFCLGLLRDPELAREATQESAYRFLRDLPRFRGRSSVRTWAFGIALNVCREMRRRRQWTDQEIDQPDHDDPAGAVVSAESAGAVRAVLDELPGRQREAVILRFFEGLSVEETAEAMNCAQGTVKATVHQALRWLKERLKAYR